MKLDRQATVVFDGTDRRRDRVYCPQLVMSALDYSGIDRPVHKADTMSGDHRFGDLTS